MYMTVDDVVHIVQQIGRGALLEKIDIELAYPLIPVHSQDRPLQAVRKMANLYLCGSHASIWSLLGTKNINFNAVADALAWHQQRKGITHILHYLANCYDLHAC